MGADIAAVAMEMKSAQVAQAASVAVMKKTMDTQSSIAMNVIDSLMNLDVGMQTPQKLDIQI
ncbi:MAG: putative motility protein [Clostridia bacterium]|nr:putative motility protein [Clostridia bacterium]